MLVDQAPKDGLSSNLVSLEVRVGGRDGTFGECPFVGDELPMPVQQPGGGDGEDMAPTVVRDQPESATSQSRSAGS
jgi:hypothetical protein